MLCLGHRNISWDFLPSAWKYFHNMVGEGLLCMMLVIQTTN